MMEHSEIKKKKQQQQKQKQKLQATANRLMIAHLSNNRDNRSKIVPSQVSP